MRQLSKKEVEKLFEFTHKHYVEFYDLQCEFVDHLANDIENQWEENEQIPFRDALQIAFKKFGVFGFTELVYEKSNQMTKKYHKILWKEFKQWISVHHIVLLLIAIGIFFQLLHYIPILFITFFFYLVLSVKNKFLKKKTTLKLKYKLLLNSILDFEAINIAPSLLYLLAILITGDFQMVIISNLFLLIICSTYLSFCLLIDLFSNHILTKRIDLILTEEYGEIYTNSKVLKI